MKYQRREKKWIAVGFDANNLGEIRAKTKAQAQELALQKWGLQVAYVEIDQKAEREYRNKQRRARDESMRGLGLVKVRGAMGGTYWE